MHKQKKNAQNIVKEIYFIRHGKTTWNDLGKTQGQEADTELNDIGIKQANITGKYLNKYRQIDMNFDCVLSSPLKRCKKTSKIICQHIKYNKGKIIYMNELMEVKKGTLSELTNKDELVIKLNESVDKEMKLVIDPIEKYKKELLDQQYELFYKIIKKYDLPIDGLETYDEVLQRIKKFIKYLKTTNKQKILVITHSGILEFILKYIFNLSKLPRGDYTNGKNCSICCCTLKNKVFTMVAPQNTEHLSLDL